MEKFILNFKEEEPKYIQISSNIKILIDSNEVKDGEKLPTIRSLSEYLKVNKVTIVNAYKKLEQEGYAHQKMGSGTYAKKRELTLSFRKKYNDIFKKFTEEELKNYIDFTGETASSTYFPVELFKDVLNKVIDRDGAKAFIYKESLGYEGLRRSIKKNFWNEEIPIDDILIVSGAQQGIDIVSKSLINVNDNVVVEKPTYNGALSVFKWRRANVFETNMEQDGINLEEFEKFLKKNKIKCFYTMSYFQNPTGISYSHEKKKKILDFAKKYDFYIIEDDYLSELIYDNTIRYESFKTLDKDDRVIYIKSFSKIFLPGIRLGYLIAPEKFKESMQSSKINTDISTSSLMQRALAYYIDENLWKKHIEYLNNIYKERYEKTQKVIEKYLKDYVEYSLPGGGLNFYFTLKNSKVNCVELFYKCKNEKILITPGVLFFRNGIDGLKNFRIGFSELSLDEIEKGIIVIKDILEKSE